MNSATLRSDTGTVYLQSFNTPHDAGCPMLRELKEDEDTTRSGTRKTAGSLPISYRSFLPREENGARLQAAPGSQDDGNDRLRRKRRPRLPCLLLTLIDDEGLNVIPTLAPFPTAPTAFGTAAAENFSRQKTDQEQRQCGADRCQRLEPAIAGGSAWLHSTLR